MRCQNSHIRPTAELLQEASKLLVTIDSDDVKRWLAAYDEWVDATTTFSDETL
jgi:hypothetical protein